MESPNEPSVTSPGAVATVDYAKSFHLRFAGNSTVRKKRRPKLRQRREDDDDDTTTDEEYDFDGDDAGNDGENGLDSQEMRTELSQRELLSGNLGTGDDCMNSCQSLSLAK